MVVLSKAVWVQTFGFARELFPYDNPAIFSMPIAFLGIWAFSRLDASSRAKAEVAAFDAQYHPIGDGHRGRGCSRPLTTQQMSPPGNAGRDRSVEAERNPCRASTPPIRRSTA